MAYRAAHRVGPHRIGWALGEARSTVSAVLARHRMPRLWELDRPTGQVVRYQRQVPVSWCTWTSSAKDASPMAVGNRMLGQACARGGRVHQGLGDDFLHVAVDDCSRVAYVEALADERGPTSAGFAAGALAFYRQLGVPVQQVMTDNGAGYRSRAFAAVLASAQVRHLRTRPYRPQSNGKVERLNHTINLEWAYASSYHSNQARLEALPGWVHAYNYHRPHTARGGQTPMQTLNNLPRNHT